MPLKPFKRRIDAVDYKSAGGISTISLPREFMYRSLMLRLTGSVKVNGGTGAGSVHQYAALKAIDQIEIIANGRDTIVAVPPEELFVRNAVDYGAPGVLTNPADDAADTTYDIEFYAILDMQTKRGVRPIDTLFPSAALSTLQLKITWGDAADMFPGNDATSVKLQDGTELQVMSFEEIGSLGKTSRLGVQKRFEIDDVISAKSSNKKITLPVGNNYANFLFNSMSDGSDVDTIIDGISLESGTKVFQKWQTLEELIGYNKTQYGLESALKGWYSVDFLDSDGFLREILDASELSRLDAVLDVAVPGTTDRVRIFPQELIVPEGE